MYETNIGGELAYRSMKGAIAASYSGKAIFAADPQSTPDSSINDGLHRQSGRILWAGYFPRAGAGTRVARALEAR